QTLPVTSSTSQFFHSLSNCHPQLLRPLPEPSLTLNSLSLNPNPFLALSDSKSLLFSLTPKELILSHLEILFVPKPSHDCNRKKGKRGAVDHEAGEILKDFAQKDLDDEFNNVDDLKKESNIIRLDVDMGFFKDHKEEVGLELRLGHLLQRELEVIINMRVGLQTSLNSNVFMKTYKEK
ncbi:unnamed protein product, partial [Prunus brigantina]